MRKLYITIISVLGIMSVGSLLSSCGPMNSEKKADAGGTNPAATLRTVNSSANNSFLVYAALQGNGGTASVSSAPQVGDNVYAIRCVHADDLRNPTDQMRVTVNYWMPDMPAMGKSDATATKQPDGTYTVTLSFGMAGRWQMTVTMQDGSKQDTYVFEAKF